MLWSLESSYIRASNDWNEAIVEDIVTNKPILEDTASMGCVEETASLDCGE